MSVRVTNHTAGPLSVPGPLNRVLRPGETRDFPYVMYDEMANDFRFIALMEAGSISMENTDAAASDGHVPPVDRGRGAAVQERDGHQRGRRHRS
jgi:hypothetical protein